MKGTTELLQRMVQLESGGRPFVCVTLAKARGSVPQEVGAKMLVTATGRECGTVGGGRVEEAAIGHAKNLLVRHPAAASELVEWNLQSDIGMTCGGVVHFLFEPFVCEAWTIAIFGAGHVSQALTRVLLTLDCRVLVYDTRPEMLALLPEATNVETRLMASFEDGVAELPGEAFVVVMTQGHRTDLPILVRILQTQKVPYLGAIGSASKAAVLRRELRDAGVSDDAVQTLRCPIGIPLGRDTPEEIAVSIAAELLQIRGT